MFDDQAKLIESMEKEGVLGDLLENAGDGDVGDSPMASETSETRSTAVAVRSRRSRRGHSEDINAEFNKVYRELKYRGWRHVEGDRHHDFFYLMPGIKSKSAGTRHRNVLTMEEVVMWTRANPTLDVSSFVGPTSTGDAIVAMGGVSVDGSSISEHFNLFWPRLQELGWSYVGGDLHHSWFYMPPGISKKSEGVRGVTLFTEAELLDVVKSNKEILRSRNALRILQSDKLKSSCTTSSTPLAPTPREVPICSLQSAIRPSQTSSARKRRLSSSSARSVRFKSRPDGSTRTLPILLRLFHCKKSERRRDPLQREKIRLLHVQSSPCPPS